MTAQVRPKFEATTAPAFSAPPLISMRDVSKSYRTPAGNFPALKNINLEIRAGDFLAIVGKSGSGKSTLVNVMTGIDTPTSGTINTPDGEIQNLSQEQLSRWRGDHVGVVFQFFQLLPTLTVAENIMLPMDFCNSVPAAKRRNRAEALLDKLDILEQADKLPADLSGGQQQRAAIARALANDPPLIVADEPTGNLDTATSAEVMRLFADLTDDGKAVVMVTHERERTQYFTRTIELSDGREITARDQGTVSRKSVTRDQGAASEKGAST